MCGIAGYCNLVEAGKALQANLSPAPAVMNSETRHFLRTLFAEDIALLQKYISFECSDWK